MINLKNLNVVLTGATGVIGNSILDKLILGGATVLATGTNEEKLKKEQSISQGKQDKLQAIIDDKDATIDSLETKIKEDKKPYEDAVENLGSEIKYIKREKFRT